MGCYGGGGKGAGGQIEAKRETPGYKTKQEKKYWWAAKWSIGKTRQDISPNAAAVHKGEEEEEEKNKVSSSWATAPPATAVVATESTN